MQNMIVNIAAFLSTLLECDGHWCPASNLYLLVDCNIETYNVVASVMCRAGWVGQTPTTLTLTPAGIEKAKEIDAALRAKS